MHAQCKLTDACAYTSMHNKNERTNTLARTHTLAHTHTHIHEHEHEHEHLRSYTYGRTRVQACMHARTPDRLPCWLAFCAWNQHTPYTIIYLGLGFRISYVQDMNNLFNDFVYQISQNTILSVELKKRSVLDTLTNAVHYVVRI